MEGDNFETPNTFYVKGKQKSLELHTVSVDTHSALKTMFLEWKPKHALANSCEWIQCCYSAYSYYCCFYASRLRL